MCLFCLFSSSRYSYVSPSNSTWTEWWRKIWNSHHVNSEWGLPPTVHEDYHPLYVRTTTHCTWGLPPTVHEDYHPLYMRTTTHCTWGLPPTVHEDYYPLYTSTTTHCTWALPPTTVREHYHPLYMRITIHCTWGLPPTVHMLNNLNKWNQVLGYTTQLTLDFFLGMSGVISLYGDWR